MTLIEKQEEDKKAGKLPTPSDHRLDLGDEDDPENWDIETVDGFGDEDDPDEDWDEEIGAVRGVLGADATEYVFTPEQIAEYADEEHRTGFRARMINLAPRGCKFGQLFREDADGSVRFTMDACLLTLSEHLVRKPKSWDAEQWREYNDELVESQKKRDAQFAKLAAQYGWDPEIRRNWTP